MSNEITTTTGKPNGFGMLLAPETIEAAREIATTLSKSELVPKAFAGKPNDILIAGAMGHRLGLDLFSALAGIAVVNGRPTLWGDAQLAVCQARPDFGGMEITESGDGDAFTVRVSVTRKGHASPYVGTFSMRDAATAGLKGKQGPWTQYPKRMVLLRARALALRSAFADALAGFHAREEIEEEVDVTASATVHADPKPAKRRTVEAQGEVVTTPPAPPVEPQAEAKTVGEHLAEAQAKPKDLSVDGCTKAFAELWNRGEAGKSRAKGILTTWGITKVAELATAADADREAFLADVAEGMAALEG